MRLSHHCSVGELDGIQESSTKRSSGLAVNSHSMEIPSSDLVHLADFFDCVDFLVDLLELTPAEKSDAAKKDNTSTCTKGSTLLFVMLEEKRA